MPKKYFRNYSIKKQIFILCVCLICITAFTGCKTNSLKSNNKENSFITKSGFFLNTNISITIYDKQEEQLINECFDMISKYEKIFSKTDEDSELYRLNNNTASHKDLTYQLSDELSDIIDYALYYSRLSKGAFDLTIEPLTSLWNFTSPSPEIPSETEINKALSLINYNNLSLDNNKLKYAKEGIGIDLGAIAKGYIADKLKEYLISQKVNSAIINLGGNILLIGSKPDTSPFNIGIQKPFANRNETAAIMEISDLSIVSSGIYERYFTIDNKKYHHILNPDTGYPYENNLISVTIISKYSVDGDGLSTTCFALGLEAGLELISNIPDTYAVFITSDYKLHYSDGFLDSIKVIEN